MKNFGMEDVLKGQSKQTPEHLDEAVGFVFRKLDGSLHQELYPSGFVGNVYPQLNQEDFEAFAYRNFDLNTSKSILFQFSNSIGDFMMELEDALRVKAYVKKESATEFEFFASLPDRRGQFFQRFLERFSVFDGIHKANAPSSIQLKYPLKILKGMCRDGYYVDLISVGHWSDYNWARWGLPGRAFEFDPLPLFQDLPKVCEEELSTFRKAFPEFPKSHEYVLFCPDALSSNARKAWPLTHWHQLSKEVTEKSNLPLVVLSANPELKNMLSGKKNVFFLDFKDPEYRGDFLVLVSLIQGAKVVVGVDSGPAHVAGFLRRPCISLWGPTSPAVLGRKNNVNLRVSGCPPCSLDGAMARICRDNVCMKHIRPEWVGRLLQDALQGKYVPR
jgi:hypothetical protein